jgi:hypothetical protein
MAKKVDAFPDQARSSKYPWDEWLDGGVWELVPGKDFEAKPMTFRSAAIAQAKTRGGKVRTRIMNRDGHAEKMYVQFFREGGDGIGDGGY